MESVVLDLEGWFRKDADEQPKPVKHIQFTVSEECHLRLEEAEQELQRTHRLEKLLDADLRSLEVKTSSECGPLEDCQLRVYLESDDRGHFHLVGHRASDHSLVYSNAVLIDQLI